MYKFLIIVIITPFQCDSKQNCLCNELLMYIKGGRRGLKSVQISLTHLWVWDILYAYALPMSLTYALVLGNVLYFMCEVAHVCSLFKHLQKEKKHISFKNTSYLLIIVVTTFSVWFKT